jgi:RHS repeat-associated protein
VTALSSLFQTIRYNRRMRSAAAKRGKLLRLVAALFVCLALAAPIAEASRYLPGMASSTPSLPPLEALDQVDRAGAEPFPLLTDGDARQLVALALLDAPAIARLTAEKRLRPLADPGAIPRPVELAAIRKLASGVFDCWPGLNIRETGCLPRNCVDHVFQGLWTDPSTGIAYARNRWYDSRTASWLSEDPLGAVDSPNLYAFVGWGPQAGADPLGLEDGCCSAVADALDRAADSWAHERAVHAGALLGPEAYKFEYVCSRGACSLLLCVPNSVLRLGKSPGELIGIFEEINTGGPRYAPGETPEQRIDEAQDAILGTMGDVMIVSGVVEGSLAVARRGLASSLRSPSTTEGLVKLSEAWESRAPTLFDDLASRGLTATDGTLELGLARARAASGLPVSLAGETPVVNPSRSGLPPVRLAGESSDVEAAIDSARSQTMFRLPAQNPSTGQGLVNLEQRFDPTRPIALHETLTFEGIADAPTQTVQVRPHSPNTNAPLGTYSRTNPTTQISSPNNKWYMLPDGTWKKWAQMSEAEKAAAHFP